MRALLLVRVRKHINMTWREFATIVFPDIDECLRHTSNCTHKCVNTAGGFYCTCPQGYVLASDHRSCTGEQGRHLILNF